jgi:hypothetical protein
MQYGQFKKYLFEANTEKADKLRIGVLVDEIPQISAFAEIIRDIHQCDFAEISLIVVREQAPTEIVSNSKKWVNRLQSLTDSNRRKNIGYQLYKRLDQKKTGEDTPLRDEDISDYILGVPRLTTKVIEKGFTDRFLESDIQTIRTYDLDVILRFGFRILRGQIFDTARYGVWSYHHGDNEYYRGGPSLFWENYEASPQSGVILQILNDRLDDGKIIEKAIFATDIQWSNLKNRYVPYIGAQHLVIKNLRRLKLVGWEHFQTEFLPDKPYLGKQKIYRAPTNNQLVPWLTKTLVKKVTRKIKVGKIYSQWQIGIRARNALGFQDLKNGLSMSQFRWIKAPLGNYWADPVLFDYNDKTYLFFEAFSHIEQRGTIRAAEVLEDGSLSSDWLVLDTGKHSSFPFLFEENGDIFMIPETTCDGCVDLYKAHAFPHQWVKEKTLIDMPCVDTIVWRDAGKYWLHTGYDFKAGPIHTALLFSSDSLFGEWKLHPSFPVSPDVRYARNGGSPIRGSNGELFRISQSSETSYGCAFSFHQINQVTDSKFSETLSFTVKPLDRDVRGTHTYGQSKHFEVVDVVWNVPVGKSKPDQWGDVAAE